MSIERRDPIPFILPLLALLSYGRVWYLHDGIWDDNTWLASIYATGSLREFLNTGFVELRRELLGAFLYYFLSLHKTTDFFYPLLHSVNLLTQILSPLLLYHLLKSLFPERPMLATVSAFCWVSFPLDHTLPYISSINYRIGMSLTLASLYYTHQAFNAHRQSLRSLIAALLTAALSQYVFLEPTITMEPGRAIIAWLSLVRGGATVARALPILISKIWPFWAITLSLIGYKLLFKPYGMYEGVYPSDPLFFLHPKQILDSLHAIVAFERRELGRAFLLDNTWAIILGVFAFSLVAALFAHLQAGSKQAYVPSSEVDRDGLRPSARPETPTLPLFLGAGLLVFPVAMFSYAHLPFTGEQHNTHAALLQIGFSLLFGTGLSFIHDLLAARKKTLAVGLSLSLLFGSGVAFNNKYLDLYFHSWQEQSKFLKAFLSRFPSLPGDAVLLLDVRDEAFFSDLRNPIDFEYPLNLLYAESTDPSAFRRRLVSTPDELRSSGVAFDANRSDVGTLLTRRTHWGDETLRSDRLIVAWYRKGTLLVNQEILLAAPDTEYRAWLSREFPVLPASGRHVWRERVEGIQRD